MNPTPSTTSSRSLAHVALFAALIAVMGLIPKIDLPFGVPITLQTLGVMMAGCLLGARRGFLAVGLFLLMVALGLPLLAGGRGGLGVFVAPSAGFLIGWPFGAAVCGFVMRRLSHLRGRALLAGAFVAALVGGIGVVYAFGIAGLALVAKLSVQQAALASAVFIPGDLVKCAICAAVVQTVVRGLPHWRLAE
ncbi:biotin transport system substrate-specific component [Variovorax sp. HW608]|uniref:biotin transporter BioY n=1 Tax=Variovorax sp. HW608 TaxID=1034889 RepID=UPI00081FB589|nr:biotin transporter BioY [Variovorax sp. HW608]SCK17072.1 biotin transport system substrate-specific component [Variovorax sp. HW608]